MADKNKSGKEPRNEPRTHSPHPNQKRIKPVILPPTEDPAVPQGGAPAQPQINVPGNQGSEGDKFKSSKDRHPSPHPRELRPDHVDVAGARSSGFGISEAIVSSGAVGGSVTTVDVHPHGEVKQAMEEKKQSKDGNEAPGAYISDVVVYDAGGGRLGAFIRSISTRVRRYVNSIKHGNPPPIPEPLPPTEFSSDSGTHTSLASGPLNLPDINYSVTDSEETSDQISDRPMVDPVQHSPEEEKPDPRATSVPEAERPKPEDPGRRAKSAAAVLETDADLHSSPDSDSEGDQDGTKALPDDGSSPVPVASSSAATPGNKDSVPHRESEGGDSCVLVLPEGTQLIVPQDCDKLKQLEPKQDPRQSEMVPKTQQNPGSPASNVYLLRTESPVEIQVSQDVGHVHTCISFETTPPTSDGEHDSGESDRD